MKIKKSFNLLMLGCIFFASCNNEAKITNELKSGIVPYSQKTVLESYQEQENIVNYKTMRTVAFLELKKSYKTFGFEQEDTLSELPVAILNENTNLPDYYEFTVLRAGENVGYITTVANKELGEPVQFISNEPKVYSENVRSAVIRGANIYNADYPSTKALTETQRSAVTDKQEVKSNREVFLEYLSHYSDEYLNEYGCTREEIILDYDNRIAEENERLSNLWYELENDEDSLLALDDETITARTVNYSFYDDHEWRLQFLQPWVDLDYKFVGSNSGYCGPTALGILLAGYYTTPFCGPYVNALINAGLKPEGPVYHPGMNTALKAVTNNVLRLGYHTGHNYNHVWNDMAENKLPIISLRTGFGNDEAAWHYRVIIGMAQRNDDNKSTYKWEKLTTSDYYYLADNSTDAENGSERPHPISGFDYEKGSFKFWEIAKENGNYFQHFPVMYK